MREQDGEKLVYARQKQNVLLGIQKNVPMAGGHGFSKLPDSWHFPGILHKNWLTK